MRLKKYARDSFHDCIVSHSYQMVVHVVCITTCGLRKKGWGNNGSARTLLVDCTTQIRVETRINHHAKYETPIAFLFFLVADSTLTARDLAAGYFVMGKKKKL